MPHKHLPHIDLKEHYQFITFRTQESLDPYLQKLYSLTIEEKKKRYLMDDYLDKSLNGCLIDREISQKVIAYYREKEGYDFDLEAVSTMPNHIHVLVRQRSDLSRVVQILKGGSAHIVNTSLKRKGKVWASDYFDRIIRNQDHFDVTYAYIKNNALKAELTDAEFRFYGVYE